MCMFIYCPALQDTGLPFKTEVMVQETVGVGVLQGEARS